MIDYDCKKGEFDSEQVCSYGYLGIDELFKVPTWLKNDHPRMVITMHGWKFQLNKCNIKFKVDFQNEFIEIPESLNFYNGSIGVTVYSLDLSDL